jgi:hypothetical protein
LQQSVGEVWTVDHIECDSSDVDVEEIASSEGLNARCYKVRQRVVREGHQSSVVRFSMRGRDGRPLVVSMEVTYHGDATGTLSDVSDKGKDR